MRHANVAISMACVRRFWRNSRGVSFLYLGLSLLLPGGLLWMASRNSYFGDTYVLAGVHRFDQPGMGGFWLITQGMDALVMAVILSTRGLAREWDRKTLSTLCAGGKSPWQWVTSLWTLRLGQILLPFLTAWLLVWLFLIDASDSPGELVRGIMIAVIQAFLVFAVLETTGMLAHSYWRAVRFWTGVLLLYGVLRATMQLSGRVWHGPVVSDLGYWVVYRPLAHASMGLLLALGTAWIAGFGLLAALNEWLLERAFRQTASNESG